MYKQEANFDSKVMIQTNLVEVLIYSFVPWAMIWKCLAQKAKIFQNKSL